MTERFYTEPIEYAGKERCGMLTVFQRKGSPYCIIRWDVHTLDGWAELSDHFLIGTEDELRVIFKRIGIFLDRSNAIHKSKKYVGSGSCRWGYVKIHEKLMKEASAFIFEWFSNRIAAAHQNLKHSNLS